jgi:outer membrane translocation and assembly module TamA
MSDENQPLGGKSLIDGSIELRTPLWKELTTVWFVDYGQVNLDELQYNFSDLHYAAGGGLRYATPFGPIRLDIASPLGENSKKVQFFISLGQAF